MAKGILYVESKPVSPERADEFNKWYEETHMPEVVALEGFVSARRFKPTPDDGTWVAIYELEADDLSGVVGKLGEAMMAGKLQMSDAIELDPPPQLRIMSLVKTSD